jgi:hypothetical protein
MSNDPANFTKLVPGFEFLQTLVKNAGTALPGIGQWVAPTIDPAEVEKRIEELRTVQFWLEQNARMLGATIQAMEVQRMTLSTLKTMNVQMEDLRDSLQLRVPKAPADAEPEPELAPPAPRAQAVAPAADEPAPAAGNPGVVDPMQWWGALTKQFTELATTAMKDTASDAARGLAGAMVKKSFDAAAGPAAKPAAPAPAKKAARKATRSSAAKTAARKKAAAAPR